MRIERVVAADAQALGPAGVARRLRELVPGGESVAGPVREIIENVRRAGDEALARYTVELDTRGAPPRSFLAEAEDLDRALVGLPRELVAGLQVAIANVARVAESAVREEVPVELPQGHRISLREVPVRSAAVYVPGGRAPYPSTVVMGVVTARAAGVLDVAVASPPGPDGDIDPAILGTCRLCGVERVYRMGGAQAIAALAFGTDTVTPVEVVVGPGNLYVQEAKVQLAGTIGIDGFAGPSDLLVLLSGAPTPSVLRLVALDILAQAEHGPGTLAAAVSPSSETSDALAAALEELVVERPTVGDAAIALVDSAPPREAIAIAEELAPEHLQLIGEEVEELARRVTRAGCVFVGAESGTAFGDYVAGSNHVLPTSGSARFASTLSPRHFRRQMSEVRIGSAAGRLAAAGVPVARSEGFDVHAESMEARVGENP